MESIPELSTGEKEDNIHYVPGKGGELARYFGNAMEVDVDKGYLEEWNAPGLSKVLPQRGGPVRKERMLNYTGRDIIGMENSLVMSVVSWRKEKL